MIRLIVNHVNQVKLKAYSQWQGRVATLTFHRIFTIAVELYKLCKRWYSHDQPVRPSVRHTLVLQQNEQRLDSRRLSKFGKNHPKRVR